MRIAVVVAFLCPLAGCWDDEAAKPEKPVLRAYAGAGLRRGLDAAAKAFEQQSGVTVQFDYAGSGTAITRAKLDSQADLFIPGDVYYVDQLHEQAGLIAEKVPVAWFVPVIVVRDDNPHTDRIAGLADLADPSVSLALGNPDRGGPQIGRLCRKMFRRNDLDPDALFGKAKLSLTVNELALWVEMRDVDAAIVWDAIAANYPQLRTVRIPPERNVISRVVAGVMTTSPHPDVARQFTAFLTSPAGQVVLNRHGYQTTPPEGVD